jgi:hypothetical protein
MHIHPLSMQDIGPSTPSFELFFMAHHIYFLHETLKTCNEQRHVKHQQHSFFNVPTLFKKC